MKKKISGFDLILGFLVVIVLLLFLTTRESRIETDQKEAKVKMIKLK